MKMQKNNKPAPKKKEVAALPMISRTQTRTAGLRCGDLPANEDAL